MPETRVNCLDMRGTWEMDSALCTLDSSPHAPPPAPPHSPVTYPVSVNHYTYSFLTEAPLSLWGLPLVITIFSPISVIILVIPVFSANLSSHGLFPWLCPCSRPLVTGWSQHKYPSLFYSPFIPFVPTPLLLPVYSWSTPTTTGPVCSHLSVWCSVHFL